MRISDWSSDVCSSDLFCAYADPALHDPQTPHSHCRRCRNASDGGQLFRQHKPHRGIWGRRIHRKPAYSGCWHDSGHDVPEPGYRRSEEHTSELQSLMRISYAVFCLKKKKINKQRNLTVSTNL